MGRDEAQTVAFIEDRQLPLVVLVRLLLDLGRRRDVCVPRFLIDSGIAGKLDYGPGRSKRIGLAGVLRNRIHPRHLHDRRDHLRGDEAVPDQFVELVHVPIEAVLDRFRIAMRRCRSDRLVRLLRGLLVLIDIAGRRQIFRAEAFSDQLPRFLGGFIGDPRGVRPHVGDQAHGTFAADFLSLVELLRQGHGFFRRKAELARGVLLQPARNERRQRVPPLFLALDRLDDEIVAVHRLHDAGGVLLGRHHCLLAVDAIELRLERRGVRSGQRRRDGPVLFRPERFALLLAVADQLDGDGLHAAHAESATHLLPQQLAALVAHDPVQHATGLLRVDEIHVDLAGRLEGALDGRRRDLVEQHAEDFRRRLRFFALRLAVNLLGKMPRDRFAFTVRVGREIDLVRGFGLLLDVGEHLRFAFDRDVLRLEVVVQVHAKLAGRQIFDVPDRRDDGITAAQIFRDGPRFGGRFDDDQ